MIKPRDFVIYRDPAQYLLGQSSDDVCQVIATYHLDGYMRVRSLTTQKEMKVDTRYVRLIPAQAIMAPLDGQPGENLPEGIQDLLRGFTSGSPAALEAGPTDGPVARRPELEAAKAA